MEAAVDGVRPGGIGGALSDKAAELDLNVLHAKNGPRTLECDFEVRAPRREVGVKAGASSKARSF